MDNPDKIGIVGAGSWGTALSLHLSRKGFSIDLWVFEEDLCSIINKTRENKFFLAGHTLPETLKASNSMEEVVKDKDVILLVAPTHVVRQTLKKIEPFIKPGCLIINAGKGIENDSLFTVHQIIKDVIQKPCEIASLSGPTFSAEIARNVPSAAVAASENQETAETVQDIFSSPQLKVFTSTDVLGVELGGALKNVIAIATGISDGLKLGFNTRAALITRGLVEITRIGTALGARPETFSGLSGLGDLVLTCTGDLSRNRTVGLKLAQGLKINEIIDNMKMVAEGVKTVKSAFSLKEKYGIQASIIDETYRVIYEGKSPQNALRDLMKVETFSEFSGVKGLK